MSYRSDHDAALARAAALELELAESEKAHDASEAQLSAARQELAQLRSQLASAQAAAPPTTPNQPAAEEALSHEEELDRWRREQDEKAQRFVDNPTLDIDVTNPASWPRDHPEFHANYRAAMVRHNRSGRRSTLIIVIVVTAIFAVLFAVIAAWS